MKQNSRRLITLIVIFLGLFLILLLKSQFSKYFSQKPNQPFAAINKDQVSELDIVNDSKTIKIIKKSQGWVISGKQDYPADMSRTSALLDNIIALKKGDIVSTNKTKQKDLGIDKQKIEIKQANKTYILYIGNSTGLSNNYVRANQENEVFTASGFDAVFSPDDYRDLGVNFVNDVNKISSIEISFDNQTTKLDKKGNDWKIGNKIAKKDRVDYFLNDLKTLKANDLLANETNLLENPDLTIIVAENKQEKRINFFVKDKDNYFAQSTNANYIFQIATVYVESLKKEEKDFTE